MVSADTMRLLSSVRRGSDETEQLLGMRPNQIAIRIGAAARQAKLKPRWDVHMAGGGDRYEGYAGAPLLLIAGWSGSGA